MIAAFLDSNILLYTYADDPKSERSYELIAQGYVIGVQTLNEFAYAARPKLKRDWPTVIQDSADLAKNASTVVPTELSDHIQSLTLARRYQLAIFDALMLAIALRAQCTIFYSEDMHHGLVIEDRMTILNPFA
jgi:predicted nucleic acid-binding protein